MADLGFRALDADHHYYEAEDAFTRHIDPKMRHRCMQWADVNGRKRLLVGGKVNRFIPNPTFDPVAKPGILDQYFRGRNPDARDIATLFGELDPIHPAYRDRDARIAQLDAQNLDAVLLFPTLGVGMEEALRDDPEAAIAAFRAFNRWLLDDWTFGYQERLFAAPYITLLDVDSAVAELEFALASGARLVCMRAGPIHSSEGFRSPADPAYDPFWARLEEAGIPLMYHSGDTGQLRYASEWGEGGSFSAFEYRPLRSVLSPSVIRDTLAALVCQGLFDRFPGLRVATIESGSEWVAPLFKALRKAYGQMPFGFREDPCQTLRRHLWVSPYYEDDLEGLRNDLGAGHVLFGSDYPHAEGLAEPTDFLYDLEGYDDDEIRLVMRENLASLIEPRPPSAA